MPLFASLGDLAERLGRSVSASLEAAGRAEPAPLNPLSAVMRAVLTYPAQVARTGWRGWGGADGVTRIE